MSGTWEMFSGDLYPPLPGILSDSNGPISLVVPSVVSSVGMIAKAPTHTISGTCAVLQAAFTANTTINTPTLSAVSSFTNIWGPGTPPWATGSTLFGPGIPAPVGGVGAWQLPTVLSFNSGAGTIIMSQVATATATAVPLIANIGTVQYVWVAGDTATPGTYSGVFQITWASGSKLQTVPNTLANQFTLTIDTLP